MCKGGVVGGIGDLACHVVCDSSLSQGGRQSVVGNDRNVEDEEVS